MPILDPSGDPVRVSPTERSQLQAAANDRGVRPVADRAGTVSGVPLINGQLIIDDPPELRNLDQRHEVFRRMARTDAYIAEALRSNILPLLRASWSVQAGLQPDQMFDPATGEPAQLTPDEAAAQDAAELVGANLLGQRSETYGRDYWMAGTFTQLLQDICEHLTHGWAWFHKRSTVVGSKRVYKRLIYLEPQTIEWPDIDGDDLICGVWRTYQRADGTNAVREYIPMEELALFVWDLKGMRIQGNPLLRCMYGAYRRKTFILRAKMLAAQRAGIGIPYVKRDPQQDTGDSADTSEVLEDWIRSGLGTGIEHNYLVTENPTVEAGYIQQDAGQLEKFDTMNQAENLEYSHGASTKAQMLGELPGGARATGEVQQQQAYVLVEALAHVIIDQLTHGVANLPGLIRELTDWNTNSGIYPKLQVGGVDPTEATRNIPHLMTAVGAGVVPKAPELTSMVLDRLGFPLPMSVIQREYARAEARSAAMARQLGNGGGADDDQDTSGTPPADDQQTSRAREGAEPSARTGPGGDGNTEPPPGGGPPPGDVSDEGGGDVIDDPDLPEDIVQVSERMAYARRVGLRLSVEQRLRQPIDEVPEVSREKGYSRTPTQFENSFVMLGNVSTAFENGGTSMAARFRAARQRMVEDIVGRGRAGRITPETLNSLRRSRPAGERRLVANVREGFNDIAQQGRRDSIEELGRQDAMAIAVRDGASTDQMAALTALRAQVDGPTGDGMLPPDAPIPVPSGPPSALQGVTIDVLVGELATEATVASQVNIDQLWARMLDEAIGEYRRLSRQDLTEQAIWSQLEAFLSGLSDAPIADAGRQAASVAYNEGRDLGIKSIALEGRAAYVVRTAVLDRGTCRPCRQLDGSVFEIGTPAYEQHLPPNKCLGRERCRCIYVVIGGELTAADMEAA